MIFEVMKGGRALDFGSNINRTYFYDIDMAWKLTAFNRNFDSKFHVPNENEAMLKILGHGVNNQVESVVQSMYVN